MTTPARRYARYRWKLYGKLGVIRHTECALHGLREIIRGTPHSHNIEEVLMDVEVHLSRLRDSIKTHLTLLRNTKTWRQL